jgi:hypothetical protein
MSASDDEFASHLRERIVCDLELFAHRLDQADASDEPEVWRTLREDLQRITERIVSADR